MLPRRTYTLGRSQLSLEFGDLTSTRAKVVVSSDDAYLTMGGGVSLAIRAAGGDAIALDAAKRIPARPGDVVVTTAGALPAYYVFHAITVDYESEAAPHDEILARVTRRCMELLEPLGVDSIAFPAIGAGVAGFGYDDVATQMAKLIAENLEARATPVDVTIYLFDRSRRMEPLDFLPFFERFAERAPGVAGHETPLAAIEEAERQRDKVFISYSHRDAEWLERLQGMLKPLVRTSGISVWDDRAIRPGTKYRAEIAEGLASASVGILLVSPDFLASDFITEHELPSLLEAAATDQLTILCVHLSASMYGETDLEAYQGANDPQRPLDMLSAPEQNRELVNICQQVKKALAAAARPPS
jgi:O-acetyl-ADP-ribose deacetylase (regulator of RNase III)